MEVLVLPTVDTGGRLDVCGCDCVVVGVHVSEPCAHTAVLAVSMASAIHCKICSKVFWAVSIDGCVESKDRDCRASAFFHSSVNAVVKAG